jgi:hypothetical protein
MLVGKQEVIEWLVEAGDEKDAWEVDTPDVPEHFDTDQDQDRELLEKYGVNIESLLERRQS